MVCSPNIVAVDLSALGANLDQARSLVGPETKIMGVVKSDAYGHGLIPVSRKLEDKGVFSLGVAHLEEGLDLRRNGIRCPVVVLCGIRGREEACAAVREHLTPVLYDLETAALLADECSRDGKKLNVQVKVDTGMGRLGVDPGEMGAFLRRMTDFKTLRMEGLTSHLASADEHSTEYTTRQIARFRRAIATARSMGIDLPLNNLANSAGMIRYAASHFDMVRPGIMLYGGLPSPDYAGPASLKPVMHFKGRILQVRDMPANAPVSYGRTYHTPGPQRIAVLSAGYGDGLPRSLSNTGKVLVRGRRCDILGTVCMNMVMCDASGVAGVEPGEEVVFLGSQGDETITGDELAGWSGTISYEIFCSIGLRHSREYSP
ncbi:MAG: alanine racemase [Thermodesulfobacteriota bacterium]